MMVKEFTDHGYRIVPFQKGADVSVIHTCTVTERSDAKCRRSIRHALRLNPETTVIVVGCYAQTAADQIREIPGVDYILGTAEKLRIFDYFIGPGKLGNSRVCITSTEHLVEAKSRPAEFVDHTRAFLKIQDGCDRRCAYCIVPFARGPSRSVAPEEVIRQANILVGKEYREIVLTGVHIGKYGKDLRSNDSLFDLLQRLLEIESLGRLRLSSLDIEDISDALIGLLANIPKICRHLHIPLQSGCDAVLKAMKRTYTTKILCEKIERIVSTVGRIGLGTDVIVGFPGETEDRFEETVRFIEEMPFTNLHVFPFSPRKGTPAASIPGQVEPRIRMERARRLIAMGNLKKKQFVETWVGREVDVLMEGRNVNGWMGGFTSEYLRVEIPFEKTFINRFVRVRIDDVSEFTARGRSIPA